MPGVLQVEALAQTMAVYVAKQPGFGDRIGLFAGIDEVRFKRIVVPGDTLRLEVTMEKLGVRFGKGRGVASVDGEVACEGLLSFIIPPEGVLAMTRDRGPVRRPRQPPRARGRAGRDPRGAAGRGARRRRPRAQRPGPDGGRRRAARPGGRRRGDRVRQHRHRRRRLRLRRRLPAATRTACPRRSASPPSGPTTSWATSSSTGSAACPPSAGCAPTTTRWSSSSTPRRARRRAASTRRSTPT